MIHKIEVDENGNITHAWTAFTDIDENPEVGFIVDRPVDIRKKRWSKAKKRVEDIPKNELVVEDSGVSEEKIIQERMHSLLRNQAITELKQEGKIE